MTDPLEHEAIEQLLARMVRIPSVNPALAQGDEPSGESAIAEFTRDWLAERGIDARIEEAAEGRPNVAAEVGAADGPTLALCAHLDTVSTEGMTIPPFEPRVEDGRLYGRGAYDMKGGLAAVMAAAAALAERGDLPGRVLLALVSDEEHESIGAAHFVERHSADACIVTEPTDDRLMLAHKGFVWARIRTEGRAAHGSRPDLGVSAIAKMGRIIAELDRLDREDLRMRVDDRVGPASMHPSRVRGGVGLSTYAPECTLEVERRTLPGETAKTVRAELESAVRAAGEEAEIDLWFERAPLTCDPDAPIARAVREAAREVTGATPEETGIAFWTDAAIFAGAGIPALLYGPGGEGAHAAVEWVDLESVRECARVLVEAAYRFTGSAGT